MRARLLTLSLCCLLAACSGLLNSVPPVFSGKAASDLPFRIKSHSYPTYRQGVRYRATARYQYDAQNRLIRVDSTGNGQSIAYRYDGNHLSERLTYQNGIQTVRTQFMYNARGELEKTVEQNGNFATTSTYQFDTDGQLIEKVVNLSLSGDYTRVSRFTWLNGNMVAMVILDGKGRKQSEWSYTYDQQPNYKALLPVSTEPDQPRTYNNQTSTHLDQDYVGLIDLCVNPFTTQYTYLPNGLVVRWETNGCNLYYNEIEYEPKQ